jgi:hypothetical protein
MNLTDIDIFDPDLYAAGVPRARFDLLRLWRPPPLKLAGPVAQSRSNWLLGIEGMPVRWASGVS